MRVHWSYEATDEAISNDLHRSAKRHRILAGIKAQRALPDCSTGNNFLDGGGEMSEGWQTGIEPGSAVPSRTAGSITREDVDPGGEDGLLFLDPPEMYDDCLIGRVQRCGGPDFALYDARACIEALARENGWDHEGALEWFYYNTAGAWAGDGTPGFLWRPEE
jgi:hypothetical protein